jgi:hypothetical protein
MSRQLGAVTAAEIQSFLTTAPKVLRSAQEYTNKAAAVAPKAVPVLREILPLLPYGPRLSPLAAAISSNVATILNKAPSYAPTLQQALDVLAKAPETAQAIAAVTGPMATLIQQIGDDPALVAFVDRLMRIIDAYEGSSSPSVSSTPTSTTTSTTKGIGLKYAVPWLDYGLVALKHRWLLVAGPATILLIAGAIGFGLGRISK